MKLSSKDCVTYIADWIKANPGVLPDDDEGAGRLRQERLSRPDIWPKEHLRSHGENPKDWKRRAKKTVGSKIIRAYTSEQTTLSCLLVVVLTEEDGKITNLEYGFSEQFEPKYGITITYW